MKSRLVWAVVIGISAAVLLTGCATTKATDLETFRSVAEAMFDEYSKCNVAEDVDGYIALWDEGAIKLKPKKAAVIGRDALAEMKRGVYAKWDYISQDVYIEEVQVDRDWGFVRGSGKTTARPRAGGDAVTSEAKFVTIFKRQADGSWKIYLDSVT